MFHYKSIHLLCQLYLLLMVIVMKKKKIEVMVNLIHSLLDQ